MNQNPKTPKTSEGTAPITRQTPPTPRANQPSLSKEPKPTQYPAPETEIDQVREIILGPDAAQRRMGKAEADRLREIIFGAQMEDYERRFSDLQREMDRVLDDLRQVQDSVSDFEKTQTKRIEALEREIRRDNDELRREVERLRAMDARLQQLLTQVRQQEMLSGRLLDDTGELTKTLTQQERDLTALKATVGDHRDQRERKLDVLKREIRQSEDGLRAELRRAADRLGDQKTDRKALAAMLMEIATRLETGSTVTGLLEGLTAPTRE